ncbi:hypothetical protein E2C01_001307 [Portunus trituberculatus]|uniref:Uncharacterized protein n=1 Tax=Portunus trituberculatus TaxID=210409 RepID=A0A5B7CM86_PORTR|nr:hypothetical protein [Portunus trituberculatus]
MVLPGVTTCQRTPTQEFKRHIKVLLKPQRTRRSCPEQTNSQHGDTKCHQNGLEVTALRRTRVLILILGEATRRPSPPHAQTSDE